MTIPMTILTTGGACGPPRTVAAGDVQLIPHGAGEAHIAGDVTVIRRVPPGRRWMAHRSSTAWSGPY